MSLSPSPFSSIVDFNVTFTPHPHSLQIFDMIHRISSTNLCDLGVSFTDPKSRYSTKPSSDLMAVLKRQLVNVLIAPLAADDADVDHVPVCNTLTRVATFFGSTSTTLQSLNQLNLLLKLPGITVTYITNVMSSLQRLPLQLSMATYLANSSSHCLGTYHPSTIISYPRLLHVH
jgi:hypothetical protein